MTTLTDRLLDDAREMVRLNRGMDHCHQNEKHTLPWQAVAEITRLTSEVERLEKNLTALCAWGWDEQKAKADALADAAEGLFMVIDEVGLGYLSRGLGGKSTPWYGRANDCMGDVKEAITAFKENQDG